MLLFAGAGAVGVIRDHIMDMRRDAQMRSARRALKYRIVDRGETWDPEAEKAIQWESFHCYYLCITCGHLAHDSESACPGCGSQGWVDLRNIEAAEQIRQMDRRDRREIPPRITGNATVVGAVLGAGTAIATFLTVANGGFSRIAYTVLSAGVVFALSYLMVSRIWNWLHHRVRRRYPARWKLPLPLPNARSRRERQEIGVPRTDAPLLAAPLSGRPCLGYEVSVHFDEIGDKRPPMWILEEERTLPMKLGALDIGTDGVTIDLPVEQVASHDGAISETALSRFLRQRGLFSSEGNYAVFEAIIEPDQAYAIETYAEPEGAVPIIRPAEE